MSLMTWESTGNTKKALCQVRTAFVMHSLFIHLHTSFIFFFLIHTHAFPDIFYLFSTL